MMFLEIFPGKAVREKIKDISKGLRNPSIMLLIVFFSVFILPGVMPDDFVLSECNAIINSHSTYTMNQSISVDRTCLNIQASNLTIDMNGSSLTGNGTGID
jgi:hypothetical protein